MAQLTQPVDHRARYARNVPIYYLFQFSTGFLIWIPVWIIFLQEERGLSLTQVGLMEAIFWIAMMLAEVPTGAVADRWGRRTSLLLGSVLFTAGTIAFAMSPGFGGIAVSYVILAISGTLYSGAGHALLYDSLRALGRTREYEKHVGRSEAMMTGALLGAALLGGPLAGLWGLQAVFLIGAATMALGAVVALFLHEPPRTEDAFNDDALFAAPTSSADAARETPGLLNYITEGFRIVVQQRPVLWLILLSGVVTVAFEMPDFFLQPLLREHGMSPSDSLVDGALWSALIVPSFAAMSIGSLLAAPFVARVGERRAIPILMFMGVLLFVPMLAIDHLGIIAAIALMAGLHAAIRPIATGYINRRIRSEQRATVLSIFELTMAAQMALIVPMISASADQIDFRFAYAVSLSVVLTFGVGFWLYWRRSHRREQVAMLHRISTRIAPQAAAAPLNARANGVLAVPVGAPVSGKGAGYATISRSRSEAISAGSTPSDDNRSSVS